MKVKFLVCCLMAITLMYACKKAEQSAAPVTSQEKVKVHVAMNTIITTSNSDLGGRMKPGNLIAAKSLADSTLYSVDVRIGGVPYAQGLFNATNNFDLEVPKGATYTMNVLAIKKGTGAGLGWSNFEDGYYFYAAPFYRLVKNQLDYASDVATTRPLLPSFADSLAYEAGVFSDSTFSDIDGTYYFEELDCFYSAGSYQSIDSSSAINIQMDRISFGVKYIVHNMTEGQLLVDYKRPENLYNTTMRPYPITDTTAANFHIYEADDFRSDTVIVKPVPVTLKWQHANGTLETLGTKNLTFKKNQLTTIVVTLPTPQSSGSFSIGTLSDTWLGNTVVNF
jgi:hypothetical protein